MSNKVEIKYTQLFINNKFVDSISGKTFPVIINPATEEKICDVQEDGDADCEKAIKAAREAFDNPNVKKRKKNIHKKRKINLKI
jgi:acyl-CoA reductase-like NAD-dependent aldehyde dehydrogenase